MTQTSAFDLDTVIVGAGPAGLCAGMYAGRGMLKAVVLESRVPGGELFNTEKTTPASSPSSAASWLSG